MQSKAKDAHTLQGPRADLAEAIKAREAARKAVDDARNAEATAREKTAEDQHRAAELRAEVEKQATSDDDTAVDAILAGEDGVLLLGKGATTEIHREIEALDQRAAAFKRAADWLKCPSQSVKRLSPNAMKP